MLFDLVLSIIGVFLTILIVVGVHEGAHFLMAKAVGVKVLKFSIGFGRALFSFRDKSGTEYVIAPLPLGGYVQMLDENEGVVARRDLSHAYNRQPLYKRMLIVVAGPLSNLVLATILYWLIFVLGFKTIVPLMGGVEPGSIAEQAGLRAGEQIVAIDQHEVRSWQAISMRFIIHTGNHDQVELTTLNSKTRAEQTHHLNLRNWVMNDLKPDPLSSLGIVPYSPNVPLVVGIIKAGSPAAHSPLRMGDKLLSLGGKPLKAWEDFITYVGARPDTHIEIGVLRRGVPMHLTVYVGAKHDFTWHRYGFLGVGPKFEMPPELIAHIQYGPLAAIPKAVKEMVDLSYLNLLLFWKLISHKLSVLSLGGPITIFESAGSAFQYGLTPFLGFLAFLNVALGIVNFFPIPGLDGGHLLFQVIELVRRKAVSVRVQMLSFRLGFIFLILVLFQALTNDLLRLWS